MSAPPRVPLPSSASAAAPLRADMGDLPARLAWMDSVGIDRQVMAGFLKVLKPNSLTRL